MERIETFVISAIKKKTGCERVLSKDENINTLDLNSIDFIQLIVEIEEEYGFEFDDNMLVLETFKTIEDLIKYIDLKRKSINTL